MSTLATLTLLAALAAAGDSPRPQAALALKADRVHTPDGVIENGTVLVQDGRIAAVGVDLKLPADARLVELHGDLAPGLVALAGHDGLGAEGRDGTRQVMDGADLVHGVDREHSDWAELARAGVTSVLLTPATGSLVAGRVPVVHADGEPLEARALLHMNFSTTAFQFGVAPSSYAGALRMLDAGLEAGKGGFGLVRQGLPVLFEARERAEVQRAAAFARRHSLKGLVYGCTRVGEVAPELKAAGLGVALNALTPGSSWRGATSAVQLAEAGVPFGFALASPGNGADTLRLSAARCVRAGLDANVARAALTRTAAELAGVGDRVGAIAVGLQADLVLWSGDPLDLTSRVHTVWVAGEEVHAAEIDQDASDEDDDQ